MSEEKSRRRADGSPGSDAQGRITTKHCLARTAAFSSSLFSSLLFSFLLFSFFLRFIYYRDCLCRYLPQFKAPVVEAESLGKRATFCVKAVPIVAAVYSPESACINRIHVLVCGMDQHGSAEQHGQHSVSAFRTVLCLQVLCPNENAR